MERNSTEQALLYLITCALHGKTPEALPELDYDKLYRLSRYHSVTAMIAAALEAGSLLAEPYMSDRQSRAWKNARSNAIRKNLLFDAEREEILGWLEEQGIWYLPLKGCILKDLYPRLGMRQMADNDILFDRTYQSQVKAYMVSRGYTAVQFAKSNHDTYEKQPVYNFEFHTALFGTTGEPEWLSYYENVKDRLRKDADNRFGYHFSDEDFYVYLMLHMYKHFRAGGTGIRSLVDVYVYLSRKGEDLDWDYMFGELNTLRISEFEEKTRTLAMKLFVGVKNPVITQEEQETLSYLLGSGTYGTTQNRIEKLLTGMQADNGPITLRTKVKFCLQRLFPGLDFMEKHVPFCYRHRWSIPFFWIYRLIRSAVCRRNVIRSELRAIKNINIS